MYPSYFETINSLPFMRHSDARFLAGNPIADWSQDQCRAFVREAIVDNLPSSPELIAANARLAYWEASRNQSVVSSFPHFLKLPLTDVCNARCTFCAYVAEKVIGRSSTEEEFKRLDWLKFVMHLNPNNGLGEPFVHPGVAGMLEFIKVNAPHISMHFITNGSKFVDAHIRNPVVGNVTRLIVSLNAARADTYKRTMKIDWEPTITGLRLLAEDKIRQGTERPAVRVSVVLHRGNVEEMPELPALLRSLHISEVNLALLRPVYAEVIANHPQREWMSEVDSISRVPDIAAAALRQFVDECGRHAVRIIGRVPFADSETVSAPRNTSISPEQPQTQNRMAGASSKPRTAVGGNFRNLAADGLPPYCVAPWTTLHIGIQDEVRPCCGFFGGVPRFDWRYG
jgi:MoaA/NifB/PqqE/SkfB family radical SAM enzyme